MTDGDSDGSYEGIGINQLRGVDFGNMQHCGVQYKSGFNGTREERGFLLSRKEAELFAKLSDCAVIFSSDDARILERVTRDLVVPYSGNIFFISQPAKYARFFPVPKKESHERARS